jgi:predicted DNA-binding WGR domain protein
MKQWGRIGSRGQCRMRWFEGATAAYAALLAQARRKERRGYATPAEVGAERRR